MRVLWFNHRDIANPTSGGAERTIYEISRRLVARGHTIEWIVGDWPGGSQEQEFDGIRVHRFRGTLGPHIAHPRLVNAIRRTDVIVDDLAHALPWGSPLLGSVPGTAFFRHRHSRTLWGQTNPLAATGLILIERGYPLIYRSWPFVTESGASASDLVSLGIRPNSIVLIPPGVDSSVFRPFDLTDYVSLVYFGGLRRYKRPTLAIRVLANLHRAGVVARLAVAGVGPELESMKSLSAELGMTEHIDFLGRVASEDLPSLVGRSWVNLHFSRNEGWGYSLMEAAAAGVPSVAFECRGVSESVSNGTSGLLVKEGDLAAFSRGVQAVIDSRSTWAPRCRQWAEHFSWDVTAAAWENHLTTCADHLGEGR